jgi:hypothetical protein
MRDEFPDGWTKTIADLTAECDKGLRTSVGSPELNWARAYERSLLRPWVRFPVNHDIYEALDDTPVNFLIQWKAPFTSGGSGTLPKGSKVRVTVFEADPDPVGVYASPLEAKAVELVLVPEADRTREKYNGYILSISTADLNTKFRLVATQQA